MRLRTRGRWGIQAGLVAGFVVAAAFFVLDLVRGDPLGTPLALSRALLQSNLLSRSGVLENLAELSPGGRLAWFTAVFLAVFGLLGMLSAGLANLLHLHWNERAGAVAGFLVGAGVWLIGSRAGPVWMSSTHLTPEVILGAGLLGGWALGWYLRICRHDAEGAG